MAVVSGALIDVYSQGLPKEDYLPAVICCFIFMLADVVLVARMKIPSSSEQKLKMGDVGTTLVHPKALLFLVIATFFLYSFSLTLSRGVSKISSNEWRNTVMSCRHK